MISPGQFVRQVKREISKVHWPGRREVAVTTLMVFVLVSLAALFFLFSDQVLIRLMHFILGVGA